MSIPVVVVTEPEFARGEVVFAAVSDMQCVPAPTEEPALAEAIRRTGASHAIVGHAPYRGALYEAMRRGSVLARFGVGHDGIDKVRATAAGLLCTNTPGVLDQSVAELTIFLIGAAARHLVPMDTDLRQGRWAQRVGIELAGKTLAIVGAGRIGTAVARIASAGFGMRVVGFRRQPQTEVAEALTPYATVTSDYDEAVGDADFVSVHIPTVPETRRFMNAARIGRLRRTSWLVNTARGAVLDEAALYDALAGGALAGAAFDVFDREPYEPVDPGRDLRTLPNVVLAPHVGSHTAEANRRMAERALRNVRLGHAARFADLDLLNPDVLG